MKNMITRKLAEEARDHIDSLKRILSLIEIDDSWSIRVGASLTQAKAVELDMRFREVEYILRVTK